MNARNLLRAGVSASALALAATGLALPLSAAAQEASVEPDDRTVSETDNGAGAAGEATTGGEIVVQGFRQSLETATNLKRESPVIAEAFSAEDIGKLPDVSIAETLGRLPGLAVQRINGRAQSLSIRGLGPDYSTSLLNGRQLVSSGDNRAIEYDQYPAELIDQGVVYKVPYAGLIGQGLAGTVDLRTIRPLSKGERILAVSGRYEFNEDGSLNPDVRGWGYRATGTYVDQFADDTLGVAVGLAYQSSPSQVKRFNGWGYPEEGGSLVLGGMKPYARSVQLDRLGAFGTIEFQPSDTFNTTLDVFYADYVEKLPQRGIEFPLAPSFGAGTTITQNSGSPFADSVTFAGVQPVVRNDYDRKDTETIAVGYNAKYENDAGLLNLDVSYSRAERRLQQIESYAGLSYAANPAAPSDTVTYNRRSSGFPFRFDNRIDYSDLGLIQLTDPRGWGANGLVQTGFINDTLTEDELLSVRFEIVGKVNSGLLESIVAGVNFDDRSKSRDIEQNFLSLAGGPSVFANQGAVTRAPIPQDAIVGTPASLAFLGFGPQIAYNPFVLLENGTYVRTDVQSSDLPFPGDWTVNEKVYTGYIRADIDNQLGGPGITGNVGVQFVYTDQSSSGFNSPGGIGATRIPTDGGARYLDVLPSATLNYNISPEMKLRFGAARTLARPRMDQLNASSNASIANAPQQPLNSIFSGSGGNPELRPYRAWGVDMSGEYYFGGGQGYVSLATYYKWLEDFVNPSASVLADFAYLVPSLTGAQLTAFQQSGGVTQGFVTGPDNEAQGHIFGIEATVSLPLEIVTAALEGFGFQSSASYTESELTISPQNGPSFDTQVPGLSEWVVNSTAYFERNGFEARISHRYRTSYLAEFIGISASRAFRETYAESIFDAQIGYRFGEASPLNGLGVTLQALNLTDEPFVTFQNGDSAQVIDYEEYGRTYLLGVSYRF